MRKQTLIALFLAALLTGCTVHPPGERAERNAATDAGKPFEKPIESRPMPELPEHPSLDQIVLYALTTNAELEARYWDWRSAIEQIPQDGSQTTTLNFAAGTTITRGHTSWSSSTVGLSNDPMTDIKWPDKLDAAAKAALENARAAGLRFRKAQFELRATTLKACYDYALNTELIRLELDNQRLLRSTLSATESRNRAGSANQQDVLRAANESDMSSNDIANMQSQIPALRAAVNAILSRPADAALDLPDQLPEIEPLNHSNSELIALVSRNNPELAAMSEEVKAHHDDIRLAKLQYIPDFNLSAGSDLMGISQTLLAQATIPLFRREALDAAIAQAQANLHSTEAMRRQSANDLSAQVILDITIFRDVARQIDLLSHTILPRWQREIELLHTEYESGQANLLDVLDAQRSLISIRRLLATLHAAQANHLADLEAIAGGIIDDCAAQTPPLNLQH